MLEMGYHRLICFYTPKIFLICYPLIVISGTNCASILLQIFKNRCLIFPCYFFCPKYVKNNYWLYRLSQTFPKNFEIVEHFHQTVLIVMMYSILWYFFCLSSFSFLLCLLKRMLSQLFRLFYG